ncbi:MAG: Smr/MutS family protein [Clostridia bacterium]|nr:Smr/MutS family protein [Clostridia bacterium]
MYKVVNIKENSPNSDYALYLLDTAIKDAKIENTQVLVIIHGYGSNGVGGLIKRRVRALLKKYKKEQKIATFVGGEEWGDTNEDKIFIQSVCPETIVSRDIGNLNSGVTVVLVYK